MGILPINVSIIMKLVNLPSTNVWINPEYVTSVRPATVMKNGPNAGQTGVEVEYEGNSGYRTRTTDVYGTTVEEVVALLSE
jgi:hypothetical protein